MTPRAWIISFGAFAFAGVPAGCFKAAPKVACFEATASGNSALTRSLFEARHCQGGGVTWSALLRVVAGHLARLDPVLEPTPGWTGSVYKVDGGGLLSIDDEGDAARVCSGNAPLLASLRDAYERLNGDAVALGRTMAQASALEMECLEADGSPPRLPDPFPVPTPPP